MPPLPARAPEANRAEAVCCSAPFMRAPPFVPIAAPGPMPRPARQCLSASARAPKLCRPPKMPSAPPQARRGVMAAQSAARCPSTSASHTRARLVCAYQPHPHSSRPSAISARGTRLRSCARQPRPHSAKLPSRCGNRKNKRHSRLREKGVPGTSGTSIAPRQACNENGGGRSSIARHPTSDIVPRLIRP